MGVGDRIAAAIARIPRGHDIGIVWEYDDRRCGATSGPNALAGLAYANGESEHLERIEAIAIALEAMAEASEKRTAEQS